MPIEGFSKASIFLDPTMIFLSSSLSFSD